MFKWGIACRNTVKEVFSLMWNPNIKVINITKLVQMIFTTWFGYSEYVGYLPCGIMLFVLNVLIWSLSTSTGLSDCSIIQREISSMKLPKPLVTHSISHSTLSIHRTNLFVFQLHFYLSWNNKAWHAVNVSFFPSSVLKWLYKNSTLVSVFS